MFDFGSWFGEQRAARETLYLPLAQEAVPDEEPFIELKPGEHYISVMLRSLRLVGSIRGFSRFHGVVHGFTSLPNLAAPQGLATFHKIAAPDKLKDLDASNVDRVLQLDIPLLGPVPYVGGRLSMDLGLLAVKTVDLAAPFVGLLERLSTLGGVSVIGTAMKFIDPLKEGVSLLTGSAGAASLELGLSRSLSPLKTGWFVLVRAPRGKFDANELRVDPFDYQLLDSSGEPVLDDSYMVISINAATSRTDFVQIDEVRESLEALRKSLQDTRWGNPDELLAAFERTVRTSPDLLKHDADAIIQQSKERLGLDTSKPASSRAILTAAAEASPSSISVLEGITERRTERATYNRANALAYARSNWTKSATDNCIAIKASPFFRQVPAGTIFKQTYANGIISDEYALLPDGSTIPWEQLEDCTHFVSCCLGSPPNGQAGGLPIRQDFNTIYGRLSAQRLFDDLRADGLIDVVCEKADHTEASSKLSQLQAGDLIFYWRPANGRYHHAGLYLADSKKRIACHTYCRCDQADNYDQAWDSVEFPKYTLAKVR